ncbi:LOW QUALITY PROTEIN: uncharacterized protein LOC111831448 [Capsella rubella]|uniref:LOW QUALITY PROTEIN: uncharacterized protein LOC111831448 n=1 Tax=Capsella rubella TaxID=81985 RepID=UPI000CD51AC3|nr:LOW QUALITY PROTEIN: uncharacterized protein LOC111831448 [Capsella rubella]
MTAEKKIPTLQEVVSGDLNYEQWATIVKATLAEKGLWDVVEHGIPPNPLNIPELAMKIQPEDLSRWRDFAGKDTKALQVLQSSLPDSVFRLTLATASAKHLWDLLKEANVQAELGNEAIPEYQMLAFNVAPVTFDKDIFITGHSIMSEGIGDVRIITKEGKKKTFKNVLFVPKIDRNVLSVAEKGLWDVVENGVPPDPSKNPESASYLHVEELRRWRELVRKDTEALQILQSALPESIFRKTLTAASAKDLWCMVEPLPDHHLFAFHPCDMTVDEDMWMIYSNATNHMTPYDKYFTTLDTSYRARVRFLFGQTAMAEGMGDVSIMTKDGIEMTIKNVLYVPGMMGSALSVAQMERSGYGVAMEKETRCTIWDKTTGKTFGETMWQYGGFFLRLKVIEGNL